MEAENYSAVFPRMELHPSQTGYAKAVGALMTLVYRYRYPDFGPSDIQVSGPAGTSSLKKIIEGSAPRLASLLEPNGSCWLAIGMDPATREEGPPLALAVYNRGLAVLFEEDGMDADGALLIVRSRSQYKLSGVPYRKVERLAGEWGVSMLQAMTAFGDLAEFRAGPGALTGSSGEMAAEFERLVIDPTAEELAEIARGARLIAEHEPGVSG